MLTTPAAFEADEVVNEASRAAALLVGADALLRRKSYLETVPVDAGDALRELITEARASLAGVVDALERHAAQQAENERARQAHMAASTNGGAR